MIAIPTTPLPPLRCDYSRGAGMRIKLRVLGRINAGESRRQAARAEGVPIGTVIGWLARYQSR